MRCNGRTLASPIDLPSTGTGAIRTEFVTRKFLDVTSADRIRPFSRDHRVGAGSVAMHPANALGRGFVGHDRLLRERLPERQGIGRDCAGYGDVLRAERLDAARDRAALYRRGARLARDSEPRPYPVGPERNPSFDDNLFARPGRRRGGAPDARSDHDQVTSAPGCSPSATEFARDGL